jgi:hypothetical protein
MLRAVVCGFALAGAVLCSAPSAQAQETAVFDFAYTDIATNGQTINASGLLDVSCATFTTCTVTNITGQRNGFTITGLYQSS